MGEAIAHPGDLLPGKIRFGLQQGRTQSLHGLPDLDQPKSNGIEDHAVTQVASLLILANRPNGIDDVGQPLTVVAAQPAAATTSASAATAHHALGAHATAFTGYDMVGSDGGTFTSLTTTVKVVVAVSVGLTTSYGSLLVTMVVTKFVPGL